MSLGKVKGKNMSLNNQPILDVCCGGKMFYYDKNDERVLFCDERYFEKKFAWKTLFEVKPDLIVDFKALPFKDKSFHLVIFDPPHMIWGSEKSFMVQKYGKLNKNYKEELKRGFDECYRVLKDNGTLIFKWSESQIKLSSILECFEMKPLIMQKSSKSSHFCVFFKELN